MSKKTNITMTFNKTQIDMFDFVMHTINNDSLTRTGYLLGAIRSDLKEYLGLPEDISFNDEQLYTLAHEKNKANIINLLGQEKYDELIEEIEDEKGDEI